VIPFVVGPEEGHGHGLHDDNPVHDVDFDAGSTITGS